MKHLGQLSSAYIKLLTSIHAVGGVPCESVPDLFYPEEIPDPDLRYISTRTAKVICQHCPIVEECFTYAITTNQQHGIWGGTEPHER